MVALRLSGRASWREMTAAAGAAESTLARCARALTGSGMIRTTALPTPNPAALDGRRGTSLGGTGWPEDVARVMTPLHEKFGSGDGSGLRGGRRCGHRRSVAALDRS